MKDRYAKYAKLARIVMYIAGSALTVWLIYMIASMFKTLNGMY